MAAWVLNLRDPKPPAPAGPGFPFGSVGLALLILAAALSLCSCDDPPPRDAAAPPAPVEATVEAAQPKANQTEEEAIRERLRMLERETAAAKADLAAVRADADRKRILFLQRTCLAVAGFSLLGLFASVALWFILSGARGIVTSAGLACVGVLATSLVAYSTIGYLVVLLPWIVLGAAVLMLGGVAWGIRELVRHRRAGLSVAESLEGSFQAIRAWAKTPEEAKEAEQIVEALKANAADDQADRGVRKLVASIRGKPIPAA